MQIPFKRVKSTYIYHGVIWMVLIFFKLIMDHSIFGDLFLWSNTKLFLNSILFFYLNYYFVLPFIIRQTPKMRVSILISFIVFYVGSFILFIPKVMFMPNRIPGVMPGKHIPFPPTNFPRHGGMMN